VAASEAAPRWIWVLAAVSALALLASGVSAYVLLRPSKRHFVPRSESLTVEAPEPESEPESEPAPPAVGVPAATPTRTRTRPTGRTGVAASGPTANVAAGAVPPAVAAPTVAAPARDAHTLGELMRSHKAPGDSSPDIDSDAPLLPTQLTGDQINASLAALKGSVKDCYAQFREKGTVMVSGSVTPGGRLQEIEIGGVLAQTPTGTCALHAVRRASFPRFSGPAMTISYRYELP
jgi:hypothetical protein